MADRKKIRIMNMLKTSNIDKFLDFTGTFKRSFKLETDVTNIEIVSCVP